MVTIPLGISAFNRADTFIPETTLKNMYLEKGDQDQVLRIKRPGLNKSVQTNHPINGIFQSDGILNDDIFVHSNNKIHKVNGKYLTALGIVPGTGPVQMAATSFNLLGIVTDSGLYFWDGTSVRHILMPIESEIPVSIEAINSYFIIGCQSGKYWWINPGLKGWYNQDGPLQFATAEESADKLVGLKRRGDEIFFFGTNSVEVWSPSGNADQAFSRQAGRSYNRGCAARDTIQLFDNNVYWVGDDYIVYSTSQVPQRVSNFGIEERLRKRTGEPSAFTFGFNGHLFYVLRIPGQGSFAYDASTQLWSEFQSFGYDHWLPNNALRKGSTTYLSANIPATGYLGQETGRIYILDSTSEDDDLKIECVVSGTILLTNSKPVRNTDVTVTASTLGNTVIKLRWKDQQTWTSYIDLNMRAPVYIGRASRCGSIRQPYRTYEFTFDGEGPCTIFEGNVNVGWPMNAADPIVIAPPSPPPPPPPPIVA